MIELIGYKDSEKLDRILKAGFYITSVVRLMCGCLIRFEKRS